MFTEAPAQFSSSCDECVERSNPYELGRVGEENTHLLVHQMERRPGWPFRAAETYYATALLCWCLWILLFLLPVHSSQAPRTELEAVTIHEFFLGRNITPADAPYFVGGSFTIQISQARHPSRDVELGVRYRYLSTLVTLFYGDTQFGQAAEAVPIRFSQGYYKSACDYKSAADVVYGPAQTVDASVAWSLLSDMESDMHHRTGVPFRITVDAYVETVESLKWQDSGPMWFNLTCWVKVTLDPYTVNLLTKSCDWDSPGEVHPLVQ